MKKYLLLKRFVKKYGPFLRETLKTNLKEFLNIFKLKQPYIYILRRIQTIPKNLLNRWYLKKIRMEFLENQILVTKKVISRNIRTLVPFYEQVDSSFGIYSENPDFDSQFLAYILQTYLQIPVNIIKFKSQIKLFENIIIVRSEPDILAEITMFHKNIFFFPKISGTHIGKGLASNTQIWNDEFLLTQFSSRELLLEYSKKLEAKGYFVDDNSPVYSRGIYENAKLVIFHYDIVSELVLSNLGHQFNITGSIPEIFCNNIRILQKAFADLNLFQINKEKPKLLNSIDTESEIYNYDSFFRTSTNLESSTDKFSTLFYNTFPTIQKRIPFPIVSFLVFAQIQNSHDSVYSSENTFVRNREILQRKKMSISLGYHFFHHEEYRNNFFRGKINRLFLETEFKSTKNVLDEIKIPLAPINRYPTLFRMPFQLQTLEKYGFIIDSSDHISKPQNCISPMMYQLMKLEKGILKLSKVWECPCYFSDPLYTSNKGVKAKQIMEIWRNWGKFPNSCFSPMFHDKFCGCYVPISQNLYQTTDMMQHITTGSEEEINRVWTKINDDFDCVNVDLLLDEIELLKLQIKTMELDIIN